jgi:RNA polymerase sigma factor (TIGR02999 family)
VSEVTRILQQVADGGSLAAEELLPELLPHVYSELKRIAIHKMASEREGHTLQPTALVHEAWINLMGGENGAAFENRSHFFAAAAEAMRRILVDSARRKKSLKRGAGAPGEELREYHWIDDGRSDEMLAIDEALNLLALEDPASANLVKLRYFAGLNMEEAATALGLSLRSAERVWTFARAWLRRQIAADRNTGASRREPLQNGRF